VGWEKEKERKKEAAGGRKKNIAHGKHQTTNAFKGVGEKPGLDRKYFPRVASSTKPQGRPRFFFQKKHGKKKPTKKPEGKSSWLAWFT